MIPIPFLPALSCHHASRRTKNRERSGTEYGKQVFCGNQEEFRLRLYAPSHEGRRGGYGTDGGNGGRLSGRGFNYFDTAHGYTGGASETTLRETLVKRYPRDRYVLTDKLSTHFFNKESDIRPLFAAQLDACGAEYFDFYLMHAQDGAIFEKFKRCRAYETALELKAEGKIRHFGISSMTRLRFWNGF